MAIDWSGRLTGERHTIWRAHVRDGTLVALENGRTRAEVIAQLIESKHRYDRLAVGFDFNFSLPAWFLHRRGVGSAPDLWDLVATEGERWLSSCEPPFWGRPGRRRPDLPSHYRLTERPDAPVSGIQPKSAFQIGGAGSVGTGSLRGMPHLTVLRRAGFSIWPFDTPAWPRVMEIYPRWMTGPVHKSDHDARAAYLRESRWSIAPDLARLAQSSEDAFDAAVSALVMAEHAPAINQLQAAVDETTRLEGAIWRPEPHKDAGEAGR